MTDKPKETLDVLTPEEREMFHHFERIGNHTASDCIRRLCALVRESEAGAAGFRRQVYSLRQMVYDDDACQQMLERDPDAGQALLKELEEAKAKLKEAEEKREHSVYWYGTRFDALRDWAKGLGEKLNHEFHGIVANGAKDVFGSHEHAVAYNRLKYRAEKAEAALAEERAVNSKLRRQLQESKQGACPLDCGGCSCHIAPPCGHCTDHGGES